MPKTQGQQYPNPTIQQAVCEIFFNPRGGITDPATFGKYYDLVREKFPVIEPVTPVLFNIQTNAAQGVSVPGPQLMRYRTLETARNLELSSNRLAVTTLGRYPGWNVFCADIEFAWESVIKIFDPEIIHRIGLRYINRIERRTPTEQPGYWFQSNRYIPPAVLDSGPGLLSHVTEMLGDGERIAVTLAESEISEGKTPAFLLDIDRSLQRDIESDISSCLCETERLHEDVLTAFISARGERLTQLLSGELL